MNYSATFALGGRVESVGDTQVFGKGFRARTIIIDTAPGAAKYANPVEVRLHGDRTAIGDDLRPGMDVEVSGYIDGRYANSSKDGRQLHFTTLSAISIKSVDADRPCEAHDEPEPTVEPDDTESMPF